MKSIHRRTLRYVTLFFAVAASMALCSCRLDILLPGGWDGTTATETSAPIHTEATDATEAGTNGTETTETDFIQTEQTETETETEPLPEVTYEQLKILEEILPYGTDYIYDEEMYDDERVTLSEGEDGYLYGVWTVTFTDGVETSRERSGEDTVEPVARVVKTGVKPAYSTHYETAVAPLEFFVSAEYSEHYYVGEHFVKVDGVNGETELVYEVTEYHGHETGRRLYSSSVKTEPVTQIEVYGTKVRIVTGSLDFPVPSRYANVSCVSSWFGARNLAISPYHYGIDFAVPQGTEIYAADGGVVLQAYTAEQVAGTSSWSYGTFVMIQHVSEDGSVDMRTIYAHMSKLAVKAGDTVTKGQIIGYSGATGNVTGPHLHFELRIPVNGIYTSQKVNATDPKDYLPW